MSRTQIALIALAAGLFAPAIASAQNNPPTPQDQPPGQNAGGRMGGFGGGPGGRGGFGGGGDVLTPIQAKLHATDEEWKVLTPKLQRILIARQSVNAALDPTADASVNQGGRGGFGGRGPGGGGPGGNDPFGGPSNVANGGRGGPGGGRGGFGRGPGGFGGPDGFGPPDGPGNSQPNATQPNATQPGDPNFRPEDGPPPFGPRGGFGGPGGGGGRGGRGGFGGGGGGPGGPMGGRGNAVMTAINSLQTTLTSTQPDPAEVKDKLAAVRAARQKARRDLDAAEKDILPLLTLDQEATLVALGILD